MVEGKIRSVQGGKNMQVIKDNYQELKRLKDEYELVEWIGDKLDLGSVKTVEMMWYKGELLNKVGEIMEGGDDI